jgi:hypothetical protein
MKNAEFLKNCMFQIIGQIGESTLKHYILHIERTVSRSLPVLFVRAAVFIAFALVDSKSRWLESFNSRDV